MEYFTCNQITKLLEFESTTHLANKRSLQLFRWYEIVSSACDLVNDPFPQWAPSAHWVFHPPEAGKAKAAMTCGHLVAHGIYTESLMTHYLIWKKYAQLPSILQGFLLQALLHGISKLLGVEKLVNRQCTHLSQAFCHNSWAHGRTQGHYTTAHQSLLQWPTHLVLNNMNRHLQLIGPNCQPFKSHPRQFHDRVKVFLKLLCDCFDTYDLSEINKSHRNSPKLKRNIEALRTNAKKLGHFWTLKYSNTFPSCFPSISHISLHLHQSGIPWTLLALLMDCTLGTVQTNAIDPWIPKGMPKGRRLWGTTNGKPSGTHVFRCRFCQVQAWWFLHSPAWWDNHISCLMIMPSRF